MIDLLAMIILVMANFFQLDSISTGLENLRLPSDEERKKMLEEAASRDLEYDDGQKWRRGELTFESVMKQLDYAVCFHCRF